MKTYKNGVQRWENLQELEANITMPVFKELLAQGRAEYGWQDTHKVSVYMVNQKHKWAIFVVGKGKSTKYFRCDIVGSELVWEQPNMNMALRR